MQSASPLWCGDPAASQPTQRVMRAASFPTRHGDETRIICNPARRCRLHRSRFVTATMQPASPLVGRRSSPHRSRFGGVMQPASDLASDARRAASGPARSVIIGELRFGRCPVPPLPRPFRMLAPATGRGPPETPRGPPPPGWPGPNGRRRRVPWPRGRSGPGGVGGSVRGGGYRGDAASASHWPRPRRPASGTTRARDAPGGRTGPCEFSVPIARACSAAPTNRRRSRSLAVTQAAADRLVEEL